MKKKQELLNPVEITILPLAAHLKQISETFPPDFSQSQEGILKDLYSRLDIELVRIWLDGVGMSGESRKFYDDLDKLLTMMNGFGYDLLRAGIIDNAGFERLQETNYKQYWGLRERYNEIADYAGQVGNYLAKLARIVQGKIDAKELTRKKNPKVHNKDTANIAVMDLLKKLSKTHNPEDITIRMLEKNIGCSKGLIGQTPAWIAFESRRKQLCQKTSSKTIRWNQINDDNFKADQKTPAQIAEDNELQELIKQQNNDINNEDKGKNKAYPGR